ncbi:MAG: T9SS type A sorting domain-containing protein [Melioribacteraceae bacterium]|nr:T9SS type A sorting domain-containing protein [Melioribacteraceae bacterium]
MKRAFGLILFLFQIGFLYAQHIPVQLETYAPKYIELGKSFEVSVIPRFTTQDSIPLFLILLDNKTTLENAKINSLGSEYSVDFERYYNSSYTNAYKLINENIAALIQSEASFEIVCKLNTDSEDSPKISLVAEYPTSNSNSDTKSNESYTFPIETSETYISQSTGGNAASISNNSSFELTLKKVELKGNLLLEFWAKADSSSENIFSVSDELSNDTLITLKTNEYGFLDFSTTESTYLSKACFISENSWNYYQLFFDHSNFTGSFIVNNSVVAQFSMNDFVNLEMKKFIFGENLSGKLNIDKLTVWDYSNSLRRAQMNKHYLHFNADSSTVIFNENFDHVGVETREETDSYIYQKENILYERSDAPIFSRAPELNINLFQNFYAIEWTSPDVRFANQFILEKSYDGTYFTEIFDAVADEDETKKYFYSDSKTKDFEVVFYRVKQVNDDGSEIYSSPVKIGQGEKKYFILEQNHPNPFNPQTIFNVEVLENIEVEISVYNIVGKKVQLLHDGVLSQGLHSFTFDGSEQPSGIYFYEVKSPYSLEVKKMILAK